MSISNRTARFLTTIIVINDSMKTIFLISQLQHLIVSSFYILKLYAIHHLLALIGLALEPIQMEYFDFF